MTGKENTATTWMHRDNTVIKIWDCNPRDVDPDGTQFHRAVKVCRCGKEYPFKIQTSLYNEYVRQLQRDKFTMMPLTPL